MLLAGPVALSAQAPGAARPPANPAPQPPRTTPGQPGTETTGVTPPADYVIGPADELSVVFWREPDMSADVVVRPDGKITLPLINDIQAAGLTLEQLRVKLTEEASKVINGPNVMVRVKTINSRLVFITGEVAKPAPYPLTGPMRVLQLITLAGGLQEFANEKNIMIIRTEDGQQVSLKFNYSDVMKGKNLKQNILLKPGDSVVVP
jgi:polysaccharide export outer membrane protein